MQNNQAILSASAFPPVCWASRCATTAGLVMSAAMLAMLPPALVVILMQKWFVKGLIEQEK